MVLLLRRRRSNSINLPVVDPAAGKLNAERIGSTDFSFLIFVSCFLYRDFLFLYVVCGLSLFLRDGEGFGTF